MEIKHYDRNGQKYDEFVAYIKAKNLFEPVQATSNSPEPEEPQKDIPGEPDKENDPTRIEPGINEPVKNDPTRIDDLPQIFN